MQSRNKQNVLGIDVSHHNGVVNWKKVAGDGYKFVYLKLTEGKSYVDKTTYNNYVAAKNAGLRVGFYHYAHVTNHPVDEVNFFLQKLGDMKADLPHCLDLEESKGKSKTQVSTFALQWMEYLQKKTGITPVLYTGYSFMNNFTNALAKYPLWVARYSGSNRVKGFNAPGSSTIWRSWAMFQFTDSGKVNGIKGNVDINEMDLTFFKSIDSGINLVGDVNPPSSYRRGDSGLGVKELQQNLLKLGEKLPKYGTDGQYGEELEAAVKSFQTKNKLTADGIAGENTLSKIADLINELNKPKEEDLPKVISLGDKYSFQVRAKKDIGVYKYANLAQNQKIIKKDTVFSVYGYTEGVKAYAVPGGFVQAKDVDTLAVTLVTGGLSKPMENEFRLFLKVEGIDSELNVHATGNPSAELTVSGLDLVTVRKFLDAKTWWYQQK
ncbi:GH25 family lysozyme [Priestia megaterium]|uniref:GH25 family lysozyme n=1 Tax=Priestia megaterium TaxID=1404 RepID=UPI002E1F0636|nr:GH25 family lysozyme [Priestia megaterium]MED4116607.1 GH25 family lysozyme [Priestia megaterium]